MPQAPAWMVLTVLAVGELVCLPVAWVAWRNRTKPGARLLAAHMAAVAVWMASAAALVSFEGFGASVFWMKMMNGWMNVSILLWLLFVVAFTGWGRLLTRRTVAALSVEPVGITLVLFASPELFYGRLTPSPGSLGGAAISRGPLLWVHAAYTYLAVLVGVLLLLSMVYRSRHLYRGQAATILTATLAPWVANALYLSGTVPFDVTPGGFVISGLAFALATVRFRFIQLVPIARATVVDNVGDQVFVLDPEDRVVDINPAARRLFGLANRSVVGRPAGEMFQDHEWLFGRYADASEVDDEVVLDTPEGERYFDVQVSPLVDDADQRIGRAFLLHDVTAQRERERELERQNRKLDQFASLVSHDLRNPLNVAEGHLDLATRRDDPEHLRKVQDSYERMYELIDDVLTLAREGQSVEETEPTSLAAVAAEAWENVRTDEAALRVAGDLQFEADPPRLLRAFENLFRNAKEHGRADVTIRVGPVDPDADDAPGFFVADDGPGIPADERERIFEDGYTTSSSGTGLGLSIVESVVAAHGWDVGIEESAEGGARFVVTGVDPAPEPADQPRTRAVGGAPRTD